METHYRAVDPFKTLESIIENLMREGVPFEGYAHPNGYAYLRLDEIVMRNVFYARPPKPVMEAEVAEKDIDDFIKRIELGGGWAKPGERRWKIKAKKTTVHTFHRAVDKLRKTSPAFVYVCFDGATLSREER